jgi:hypothetical protein
MKYFFLLCVINLVGCATNHQIRTVIQPCDYRPGQCDKASIQYSNSDNYSLSFVEIDDQGHFQDREQLNTVLNYVKSLGNNQDVLLFIHGWQHNSEESDSNVSGFRSLLKALALKNGKKTTGIYIGWRGESIDIDVLNLITFWDRKNVSLEVGQGALLEFLVRLEYISKNELAGTRLISIGHSFGGSVLYSSLKNLLLERIAKSNVAVGFGDLVILLNPAIEAIHFAPLRDLIEEKECNSTLQFSSNQRPKLIIATSEDDTATRYAFPAGRVFATLFENQNPITRLDRHCQPKKYAQTKMDRRAIGHYKEFKTHYLSATGAMVNPCTVTNTSWLSNAVNASVSVGGNGEGWNHTFNNSNLKLEHLHNSSPYNPYWIIRTNGNVIPDHNHILQGHFNCFIEEVMQ